TSSALGPAGTSSRKTCGRQPGGLRELLFLFTSAPLATVRKCDVPICDDADWPPAFNDWQHSDVSVPHLFGTLFKGDIGAYRLHVLSHDLLQFMRANRRETARPSCLKFTRTAEVQHVRTLGINTRVRAFSGS